MGICIISAVKRHARREILRQLISTMRNREELRKIGKKQRAGTSGFKYGYGSHSLDSIRIVQFGFKKLSGRSFIGFWIHAGIFNQRQIRKVRRILGDEDPTIFLNTPVLVGKEISIV